MLRIGLMIEGQNGLSWARWKAILGAAERLGFDSVFRSDHFTNPNLPDKDSLEAWTALTYAASATRRIEFGPLVSPVTFRHPSVLARMAAAVDDLSGGRLLFGMGAGWQDREHHNFGIPFPDRGTRLDMLEEYLEVVSRLFRSDDPVSYDGRFFQLHDAILLPRPLRRGGPRILVGGNGPRRTLPLAARYADEWNAVFAGPDELRRLNERFDTLLQDAGRPKDSVLRSVMMGTVFATDETTLSSKLAARGRSLEDLKGSGLIAGTPDMWIEQLRAVADAGAQRVMLQWLDLDDLAGIEAVAREVLPAFMAT